jgi:hypothetical protein
VGLASLVGLLTGCGGPAPVTAPVTPVTGAGATVGGPPTDLPTDLALTQAASPTATVTAQTTAVGAAALRGTVVPKHFPFPKGATPRVVTAETVGATLALSGVTGDETIRYYRQAMPAAGYTFQQQVKSDTAIELIFVGYGQRVTIMSDGAGAAQNVRVVFAPQ